MKFPEVKTKERKKRDVRIISNEVVTQGEGRRRNPECGVISFALGKPPSYGVGGSEQDRASLSF